MALRERSPSCARLGWEPYAWLIYSVPFLIAAFNPELSAVETGGMLASYPVFLALYSAGHVSAARESCGSSARSTSSRSSSAPRNPPASCFFIYGSALLGAALPARSGGDLALVGQVALAAVGVASLLAADLVPDSRHGHLGAHRRGHHPGGGQRRPATRSCVWRKPKSSSSRRSPNASASPAICTTCSATRCRSSC